MPPRTRAFAPPEKAPEPAAPSASEKDQAYLAALGRERDYYAKFGFEDRVPDVDAEIKRVKQTVRLIPPLAEKGDA